MRIAVFDYVVTPNNAIGMCVRRMMGSLGQEHDFTLFSCTLDDPLPGRIRWIRIPAIKRPLALLYITYHFLASWQYWTRGIWKRGAYEWTYAVESNFLFADIIHAHFCHRWFLQKHFKQCGLSGLRGAFRWIDHALHAAFEPMAFRRAKKIIVPSLGLKRELSALYPYTANKITVISNPVDAAAMARPAGFDRAAFREKLGIAPQELMLNFIAMGQYERKGLPFLLEAMALRKDLPCRLVVIGGQPDLIREYEARVAQMGIGDRVNFVGIQKDVRPFLWASDAFVLPSLYEVFPLVALEAAGAGCLLMTSPLNGVEEFMVDGQNGLLVSADPAGVAKGLERLAATPAADRERMALDAAQCIQQYTAERYAEDWRSVYAGRL